MILIAENNLENQLVPGIVALLRDLKVDARGFRREDAIGPVFWSAEDFSIELSSIKGLSREEMTNILEKLEPELMESMILAGFDVIEKHLKAARGAIVYQQHRLSQ